MPFRRAKTLGVYAIGEATERVDSPARASVPKPAEFGPRLARVDPPEAR
jgi:hypothetical protein